jgi:hypothetical protein
MSFATIHVSLASSFVIALRFIDRPLRLVTPLP